MRITIDLDQAGQPMVTPAADAAPRAQAMDGGAPSAALVQSIAASGPSAADDARSAGPPPDWLIQGIAGTASAPSAARSSNGAGISAGAAPAL